MAIRGARVDHRRMTPRLLVQDAAQAVEFYQWALEAEELCRSGLPDGAGIHVHIRIGDSLPENNVSCGCY